MYMYLLHLTTDFSEGTTTTTTTVASVDVFVQVKDATDGHYLEGVAVTIVGDDTYSGLTDAQGRVDLGPLLVGSTADLTASLDGYADFVQTYTIPESGGIYINMSPVVAVRKIWIFLPSKTYSSGIHLLTGGRI